MLRISRATRLREVELPHFEGVLEQKDVFIVSMTIVTLS